MSVYYHDYLELDRLLDCQHLASSSPGGVAHDGSAAASYLTRQAERGRAFPDLMALPTFLLPNRARPDLPDALVRQLRFRFQTPDVPPEGGPEPG